MSKKMIVCPDCDGHGKHTNSAIDGNGLGEDFRNDPDFMEDYFDGVYDVACERCHGSNVVPANKFGHPTSGHPCERCGGDTVSESEQEYPGAFTWVYWYCFENEDCPDYSAEHAARFKGNGHHPNGKGFHPVENFRGW